MNKLLGGLIRGVTYTEKIRTATVEGGTDTPLLELTMARTILFTKEVSWNLYRNFTCKTHPAIFYSDVTAKKR